MAFDPLVAEPTSPDMEDLRARCPVMHTADGRWFLASYDAVLAATNDVHLFRGTMREPGVEVPDEEQLLSEIPEPRHGPVRRIVNSAIASHRLRTIEPLCRDLCVDLLDTLRAQDGVVDLYPAYVSPVPNNVIAHLLGAPPADYPLWAKWSDEVLEGTYPTQNRNDRGEGFEGAHPEFCAYIDAIIADRRANPRDDFVTRMLGRDVEGRRLTDIEARTQLLFLFIAGNATTRHLFSSLMHRLAADPDLYARLRADHSLVPALVEECLRLDPPVRILFRECTAGAVWQGHEIEPGAKVDFGLESANRDAGRFADPHELRLDRPDPKGHLAFGGGPHVCPGATLARMEARIAVEVLLDKAVSVHIPEGQELEGSTVWWIGGGPESLPVRIEWAAA
ncbi:cytochrome P450 [Dactylosporangium sp. CA-092794]|uniref:cytochrome P450 n=1 Tax=Dactylosporangium sp. CA-092794 TaxID=3239929 RepID=UPI003D94E8A9